MEEEAFADVDAPEEFPVTVQVRVHDAIGRTLGETLELLVQLARAEDDKHHDLIEIGAAARDAGRLAHHRMAAVAADQIVRLQRFGFAAFVGHGGRNAVLRLRHRGRGDAKPHVDIRQGCQFPPQHRLHAVLRQALLLLKEEIAHHFAAGRRLPVFAREIAVGGDFADRIAARHQTRGAQRLVEAPEIEMFERALGQPLPLRDVGETGAAFDDDAGDAAQAEVERERRPDRAAADDDDLCAYSSRVFSRSMPALHSIPGRKYRRRLSERPATMNMPSPR